MSQLSNRISARALSEHFINVLERADQLDALAESIDRAFRPPLVKSRRIRRLLSGTDFGHALHPAAVLLPAGSWLSATFIDCVGGKESRAAAQRLVGIGLVSAIPAALSGLSDWIDTAEAERRVGMVHAAANDAAIASYSVSWLLRRRGRHRAGAAAGALGAGLLAISGWLGGHLAYARGVSVDTTAFQVFPTQWTDTISEGAISASSAAMSSVRGVAIFLMRTDEGIVAIADRCTHRGGPLHEGEVSDGVVTCPWHGSRFSIVDGCVLDGPATRDQPVLEARVRGGMVQVRRVDEVGALRKNPVS
jgi:nitrite reductase/ring-hydroxylating ferredoxin subunit/uncharacterized membrane protein